MKKQFNNKEELDRWIEEKFPAPTEWTFEMFIRDEKEIADKLLEDGYDLDDLLADGHDYEIDSHTNNGWMYDDEISPDCIDDLTAQGRVRER